MHLADAFIQSTMGGGGGGCLKCVQQWNQISFHPKQFFCVTNQPQAIPKVYETQLYDAYTVIYGRLGLLVNTVFTSPRTACRVHTLVWISGVRFMRPLRLERGLRSRLVLSVWWTEPQRSAPPAWWRWTSLGRRSLLRKHTGISERCFTRLH